MNKFISRGLYLTLAVGGLTLLGATAANAAENTTSGDDGLLSGTQSVIGLQIPIDLSGNAISLLGDSSSSGSTAGTAATPTAAAAPSSTTGSDSVASGSQAVLGAAVPINVSGNSISLLGDSNSSNSSTTAAPASAPGASAPVETTGNESVLGGTQGLVNVAVPITAGGNAISGLGNSNSSNSTTTGDAISSTGTSTGQGASTSGENGILGGSQVAPSISVPVTAGGNAVSLLGDSASTGSSAVSSAGVGSTEASTAGDGSSTDGDDGILGGSQIAPGANLPITVGGNAVSLVGDTTTGGSTVVPGTPTVARMSTVLGTPNLPEMPTVLGTPTLSGSPTAFADAGTTTTAAASIATGSETLAFTGVDTAPLAGAMAVLLLLGLALLIVAGRKNARI